MKKKRSAINYAGLLGEYLEKLGLRVAYDIAPAYPEWNGHMSISPGEFSCDICILPCQLRRSPDISISDLGDITIRYEEPVAVAGCYSKSLRTHPPVLVVPSDIGETVDSDGSCPGYPLNITDAARQYPDVYTGGSNGFLSNRDELNILRILNNVSHKISFQHLYPFSLLQYSGGLHMDSCSRAGAKKTAGRICRLLFSLISEINMIKCKAWLDPIPIAPAYSWDNRQFSVRKAADIAAYIKARETELLTAYAAYEKSGRPPSLLVWNDLWGYPYEVLLRTKAEYSETQSPVTLKKYSYVRDYIYCKLNSHR